MSSFATFDIHIIDYSEDLKEWIKILNYEWLQKYFAVEEGDKIVLSDPITHIIGKGGYIFYAMLNEKIVGTASLLKKSESEYEIGKMAVTEQIQGYGIGTKLLEHCIHFAQQKNVQKLILYSNSSLLSAIHLYQKFGFKEIPMESGLYAIANVKMELVIK